MSELIILTEAGGSVGFGHLMRCQAISNYASAKLYVHPDGVCPINSDIIIYPWRTNIENLIEELPLKSTLLIDSYLADISVFEALSSKFDCVAVIDDFDRLIYPVDLIINPGIQIPAYDKQIAKVVSGKDYVILRDEMVRHVVKDNYDEYRNLLVTFGGSDASRIYNWLLPLLANHKNFIVNIVTGNDSYGTILAKQFNQPNINWLGTVDATHMANLMYQSDICISAGGQTLHELAYIGVPTICVETGADQINNIEGYLSLGFVIEKLKIEMTDLPVKINECLKKYSSKVLRTDIAMKGKNIVDGNGVIRIVDIVQTYSKEKLCRDMK